MRFAELKQSRVRAIVDANAKPHAALPYAYVEITGPDPQMGDRWNGSSFDTVVDTTRPPQMTLETLADRLDAIEAKIDALPGPA